MTNPEGSQVLPFNRQRWSVSDVLDFTWGHFQREWLMLSLCLLLGFVFLVAVSLGVSVVEGLVRLALGMRFQLDIRELVESLRADSLPHFRGIWALAAVVMTSLLGIFINLVADILFELGMIRVCFDVLAGGKADIGRLFSQYRKIPYAFLMALVMGLLLAALVFGGFIFAVVAGVLVGDSDHLLRSVLLLSPFALVWVILVVWVGIGARLATQELAYSDDIDAFEALKRGFAMARGMRLSWTLFALIGGAVGLLGFLLCCIGVIPAAAFNMLLMGSVFLLLRTGTGGGVPPAEQATWVQPPLSPPPASV